MSDEFLPGMRVQTKFGAGEIVAVDGHYALVEIQREHGVSRLRIPFRDISVLGNPPVSTPKPPPSPLRPTPFDERSQKLRSLNSLRFGLVPHDMLPELTYGFAEIEAWVLDCLPNGPGKQPKVSEVYGQYGTGKSHMMAVIRQIAKREGYVVARVEVDGSTVTLADPKLLLSNLWKNLQADNLNSATPLVDLYCRAMERNRPPPQFAPHGIDRIYYNYSTINLLRRRNLLEKYEVEYDAVLSCHDEFTASALQGSICQEQNINRLQDNPKVVPMIGRRVIDRPYDFIEALFGNGLVCHLAGYKGLVITFDEFEVEHHLNLSRWRRVIELIEAIKNYLDSRTDHPWSPVALFFATVGLDGHAGDEVIDELVELTDGSKNPLEELGWDAVSDIGKRIKKIYYETYAIPINRSGPDMKEIWRDVLSDSGKVRGFIKHYLAELDSMFGPPANL